MRELAILVGARARMVQHAGREFLRGSKLRTGVVAVLIAMFWLLMFAMFLDGFLFLRSFRTIGTILLDYLFAFFFASLLAMMTISNAIIAYTSLYRSEETAFLFTLPVRPASAFTYRGSDSLVFSTWGMATLVVPMIVAYGVVYSAPAQFFPMALALAALFVLLTTELGALLALAVALLLPRRRKTALAVAAGAGLVGGVIWFLPLYWDMPAEIFGEASLKSVISRIAFCQHWALPSRWVSAGMLSAARGDLAQAGFLLLTLLANVLFVGMASHRIAHYAFPHTWGTVQGAGSKRRYNRGRTLDRCLKVGLRFLPPQLRLLVAKDAKSFLRDPGQWSQFLLFFGLLGLYIVNLPRIGLDSMEGYWHSLISTLNLGATCLTLATLTSRFVFPQLSLEGRRIWVTGLLPIRRTVILWGKFFFAAGGTFLISGTLIALSDLLIGLPLWTVGVHLLAVACICCGLNGLAVGLGALYPRLGTDNPAKIVSSFGGTLNLICSICFLTFALAPVVVPLHLHALGRMTGGELALWLSIGTGACVALSVLVCVVPMTAGARAFTRMEF